MLLSLLLPWFPIVLAVGVGGRLLGRSHGIAMGILCALFWIVLVQASVGVAIWTHSWNVMTIITGAVAIVAMGGWAGETCLESGDARLRSIGGTMEPALSENETAHETIRQLSRAVDRFNDWLEEHRADANLWAQFDELIRSTLYESFKATHVRSYRLIGEDEQLVSLGDLGSSIDVEPLSARRGIIGHVVTTGRAYLAGDGTQGELVDELASESTDRVAWSFGVRQGPRRLGVIAVGQLGVSPQRYRPLLRHAEQLVNQMWCTLLEATRNRKAAESDSISGLPLRSAFLHDAELSLRESYKQGEPVAVAVIALEGLRQLSDAGRWEVADELVRAVGARVKQKIRVDDRVGRFDESRLVVLLRRVDSELASLIVNQMMARITALCGDPERWRADIKARCGVAGTGTEQPDLCTLLTQALEHCHRARTAGKQVATDLEEPVSVAGGAA